MSDTKRTPEPFLDWYGIWPGATGMEALRDGKDVCIDGAVLGLISPDGLRWTKIAEPLLRMFSDGENVAYYDEALERYVGYFRCNMFRHEGPAAWPPNPWRCVGRAETTDFRRWPTPRIVLQPDSQDPPTDDFYGNAFSWYPGGRYRVMFPPVYHRALDTRDAQLAVSRNGYNWTRPERVAIVTLEAGEHALHTSTELMPLDQDRWGLPYRTVRKRHNEGYYYARGARDGVYRWALWKRDRLVALEAPVEGQVTLLPRRCTGEPIVLNFQTEPNGWIRVELFGPDALWPLAHAEAVPRHSFAACEPLRGDSLEGVVRWGEGADLAPLTGRDLCLRIALSRAKLFAVTV